MLLTMELCQVYRPHGHICANKNAWKLNKNVGRISNNRYNFSYQMGSQFQSRN
jgi:hypothetical protein